MPKLTDNRSQTCRWSRWGGLYTPINTPSVIKQIRISNIIKSRSLSTGSYLDPDRSITSVSMTGRSISASRSRSGSGVKSPKPIITRVARSGPNNSMARSGTMNSITRSRPDNKMTRSGTINSIIRSKPDKKMARSGTINNITRSNPDNKMTRSGTINNITRSKPDKKMTRSGTINNITRSNPDNKMTRSGTINNITRSKPGNKMTRSGTINNITRSKPDNKMTRSETINSITRSNPHNKMTRSGTINNIIRSKPDKKMTRSGTINSITRLRPNNIETKSKPSRSLPRSGSIVSELRSRQSTSMPSPRTAIKLEKKERSANDMSNTTIKMSKTAKTKRKKGSFASAKLPFNLSTKQQIPDVIRQRQYCSAYTSLTPVSTPSPTVNTPVSFANYPGIQPGTHLRVVSSSDSLVDNSSDFRSTISCSPPARVPPPNSLVKHNYIANQPERYQSLSGCTFIPIKDNSSDTEPKHSYGRSTSASSLQSGVSVEQSEDPNRNKRSYWWWPSKTVRKESLMQILNHKFRPSAQAQNKEIPHKTTLGSSVTELSLGEDGEHLYFEPHSDHTLKADQQLEDATRGEGKKPDVMCEMDGEVNRVDSHSEYSSSTESGDKYNITRCTKSGDTEEIDEENNGETREGQFKITTRADEKRLKHELVQCELLTVDMITSKSTADNTDQLVNEVPSANCQSGMSSIIKHRETIEELHRVVERENEDCASEQDLAQDNLKNTSADNRSFHQQIATDRGRNKFRTFVMDDQARVPLNDTSRIQRRHSMVFRRSRTPVKPAHKINDAFSHGDLVDGDRGGRLTRHDWMSESCQDLPTSKVRCEVCKNVIGDLESPTEEKSNGQSFPTDSKWLHTEGQQMHAETVWPIKRSASQISASSCNDTGTSDDIASTEDTKVEDQMKSVFSEPHRTYKANMAAKPPVPGKSLVKHAIQAKRVDRRGNTTQQAALVHHLLSRGDHLPMSRETMAKIKAVDNHRTRIQHCAFFLLVAVTVTLAYAIVSLINLLPRCFAIFNPKPG